eukprot:403354707
MIVSEYGELLNIKPMTKLKNQVQYKQVQMISDNTDSKILLKKLHHNPNLFFLYEPKGHFANAQTLYSAMKRLVGESFYGRPKKNKTEVNPYKGTVFEKCALPRELFNVNRMVKMNYKQAMSRFGFLALRDGSLELNPKNRPEVVDMKKILLDYEQDYDLGSFTKPDYFVPFPFLQGLISYESLRTQGIKIRCLQDRMIYPLYGVFSPTSQEYLEILANYVKQTTTQIKSYRTMADLGCGTGILPIVMNQLGGFEGEVYAFDKDENCIESTQQNAQIFGLAEKVKTIEIDILEFYFTEKTKFTDNQAQFYKNITEELNIPMQFDLITCNPPWIPAEFVVDSSPLDNGVYDPKEQFLNASLNFASYIFGVQDENRVQTLANKYNLRAELIDKTGLQPNKKPNDPLKNLKMEAKVQLFRVTKQ